MFVFVKIHKMWLICFPFSFSVMLQQICHRDLKLENTLLDGSAAPRLKICDFGYSKVVKWRAINLFILLLIITFCGSFVYLFVSHSCDIVISVAFKTQVNSWNSGIHSTGGSLSARI